MSECRGPVLCVNPDVRHLGALAGVTTVELDAGLLRHVFGSRDVLLAEGLRYYLVYYVA